VTDAAGNAITLQAENVEPATKPRRSRSLDVLSLSLGSDERGYGGGGLGGGYAAARSSRLLQTYGGAARSADSLLELDRERLVEFSRGLYNATPVYRPFIDRLIDITLGTGLMPRAAADSPAGQAVQLFSAWAEDAEQCDEAGLRTFGQLQRLILREVLVAGDSPVVWTNTGRMQVIEAERLYKTGSTPTQGNDKGRVTDGVEVDASGRPVRFHLTAWTMTGASRSYETVSVEAKDVMFPAFRERPGQTRGVPLLAPAMDRIAMLDENHVAVHIANTVAAMFAVVIKSNAPAQIQSRLASPAGGGASDSASSRVRSIKGQPGMIASLEPNEDITTVQGAQPAGGWDMFTRASLMLIAACAGMPVETALMDVSKANFSVSRMAELMSRNSADSWRQLVRDSVLRPVWRRFVLRAIAAGRLSLTTPIEDYMKVEWPEPRRRMLDPQKELAAYMQLIDQNMMSKDDATLELGLGDPDEIRLDRQRERREEERMAIVPLSMAGAPGTPSPQASAEAKQNATDGAGDGTQPPDGDTEQPQA
jgi:lambda family phage portal protein